MKKGVKLVFVAAPNVELAEYLLAQRIGNIAGWQNYLAKYPAAPHTQSAKQVLAVLYVRRGRAISGSVPEERGHCRPEECPGEP